jgi:hypothetical protein
VCQRICILVYTFINQIQKRIYDQNLQDKNSKIKECEKLFFLRNIYDENYYVDNIILKSDRSNIAKLRICAHNLEIEKGRYFQINRTERFCKICNDLEIEDENHFHWQCEKYRKERVMLQARIQDFTLGGALLGEGSRSPAGPGQRLVGGPGGETPWKLLCIIKYRTSFLNRN